MEVFSFSQCWNIKALTEQLDEYFKSQEATEIFSIFELYVQHGHQSGLAWASEVKCNNFAPSHSVIKKNYVFARCLKPTPRRRSPPRSGWTSV